MSDIIRFGNNKEIEKIYFGDKAVDKVYFGERLLWKDLSVCSWADGTVEEIQTALQMHRDGVINLYKNPDWAIGSERKVTLSAISNSGLLDLTGSTWWFKGRKDNPVVIDTDGLPNYNANSDNPYYLVTTDKPDDWETSYTNYFTRSGSKLSYNYTPLTTQSSVPIWEKDKYYKKYTSGGYWHIDFNYYQVKKKGSKKKYKKTWTGKYNGIAKVPITHANSMCYLKVGDGSYTSKLVYYNTKSTGSNIAGTWQNPTFESPWKVSLYKDKSDKVTLSNYQQIKITGGSDVNNPNLLKWLLENATCASFDSSKTEWKVPESYSQQQVTLVLADTQCNGFKLASGSSDSETAEQDNQKPVFIVCQKEVLNNTGYLKMVKKDKKEKGSNSGSWGSTIRQPWCDIGYYKALPDDFRQLLQEFTWQVGSGDKKSGLTTFTNKVALPLERHIQDKRTTSTVEEYNTYSQWEYYGNKEVNNKKKSNKAGLANYWTASPSISNKTDFIFINTSGESKADTSKAKKGFAPFMII